MGRIYYLIYAIASVISAISVLLGYFPKLRKVSFHILMINFCSLLMSAGQTKMMEYLDIDVTRSFLWTMPIGMTFIAYSCLLFFADVVKVKIPTVVKVVLALGNCALIVIASTKSLLSLMYKDVSVWIEDGYMLHEYTKGPVYYVYSGWMILMFVMVFLCFVYANIKRPLFFRVMHRVLIGYFLAALILCVTFLVDISFASPFETNVVGCSVAGAILVLSALLFQEDILKESSHEVVLDSLNDLLISYDLYRGFEYANAQAKRVFPELQDNFTGMPIDEVAGRYLKKALSLKDNELLKIDDREYRSVTREVRRNDHLIGFIRWFRDVTDERENERTLEELKEDATKAQNARSSFLTHISSDIKMPLNNMMGMNQLILQNTAEDSEAAKYAMRSNQEGRVMLNVINDIIALSMIETGRMQIVAGEYSPRKILDSIVMMAGIRGEYRGVSIDIEVSDEVPELFFGDELRVRQVIKNVVDNAVFASENGTVKVRVDSQVVDDKNAILKIDVTDCVSSIYSKGISEDSKGVALKVTTDLLRLMDGSITLEVMPNRSSTYHISVPQGRVAAFRGESSGYGAVRVMKKFATKGARVLIVDDNRTNHLIMGEYLKPFGVHVDNAYYGDAGLKLLGSKKYDIVFLDLSMPDLSGEQVLQKARMSQHGSNQDIPFIALTSENRSGNREFLMRKGFTNYLMKPIDPISLAYILREELADNLLIIPKDESEEEIADEAADEAADSAANKK